MPLEREPSNCGLQAALDPPEQLVEALLARLPFFERVRAAGVCRTWRNHLSQPGLQLWQALHAVHVDKWDTPLGEYGEMDAGLRDGTAEQRLRIFRPLQRWVWRHGGGLLQAQCSTSFDTACMAEDGLLTAFLHALAAAAPSLQALRLDECAAMGLTNSSMFGIASMGDRLRQLALIGLQHVSDGSLMAAIAQLPMLQDLAVIFVDETEKHENMSRTDDDAPVQGQPDLMRLLTHIAVSLAALQTLALGYIPPDSGRLVGVPWGDVTRNARPLPAAMSRLTALSSLMLHDIGWEYAPDGLPHMPQLRRLTLRGDCRRPSMLQPELPHQLSTLASLEALQVTLPREVGRLPPGLTQLVVSPYDMGSRDEEVALVCAESCARFFCQHLPTLGGLRHLAFHHRKDIGQGRLLPAVCSAARALPQLISLHLVNCDMCVVPSELCELSRLQLLNLSDNLPLQLRELAQAPLHKMASCRWLDLRCCEVLFDRVPLQPGTIAAIAAMPALERLALPPTVPYDLNAGALTAGILAPSQRLIIPGVYTDSGLSPDDTEVALLAQHRPPGMPPIRVVAELPQSDQWAAVHVDLPFGEVNEVLGVQLDRYIMHEVPV